MYHQRFCMNPVRLAVSAEYRFVQDHCQGVFPGVRVSLRQEERHVLPHAPVEGYKLTVIARVAWASFSVTLGGITPFVRNGSIASAAFGPPTSAQVKFRIAIRHMS